MSETKSTDSQTTDNKQIDIDDWIKNIYEDIDIDVLLNWYNDLKYQGFDRNSVIVELHQKLKDKTLTQKFILACALRGPIGASKLIIDGKNVIGYGIPLKSVKGTKGVSINRITAATADYAAFLLKKLRVPKRLNCECPAWLQFPSAASITMPERYRKMHKEFAEIFSQRINLDGKHGFNEDIYTQMEMNSYLNEDLELFTD
jgi:hypothetical protein